MKPLKKFRRVVNSGFTLIELIVVIAVLGILATIVVSVINPAEQFARGRDAGRKTATAQLFHAMQAYYASHAGQYYDNYTVSQSGSTWIDSSIGTGATGTRDVSSAPIEPNGAVAANISECPASTANVNTGANNSNQNNYCYYASAATNANVVIFAGLESGSEKSKCPAADPVPYFVWASQDGQAGTVCLATGKNPYTAGASSVPAYSFTAANTSSAAGYK